MPSSQVMGARLESWAIQRLEPTFVTPTMMMIRLQLYMLRLMETTGLEGTIFGLSPIRDRRQVLWAFVDLEDRCMSRREANWLTYLMACRFSNLIPLQD